MVMVVLDLTRSRMGVPEYCYQILNTNQLTALGASSGHDQLKALAGHDQLKALAASSGHDQLRALENAFAMHLLLTVRALSRASGDEAEPTVTRMRTRPHPLIDRRGAVPSAVTSFSMAIDVGS